MPDRIDKRSMPNDSVQLQTIADCMEDGFDLRMTHHVLNEHHKEQGEELT